MFRNQRKSGGCGLLGACRAGLLLVLMSVLCAVSASGEAPRGKAALLRGGLSGEVPALVDALAEELDGAGYGIVELDADALCDAERLTTEGFDLLALPNAACLPAASVASIEAYLRGGGNILALNAPLWQKLLVKPEDEWITRDEYERQKAADLPEHVLFDFTPDDIEGWQRACHTTDGVATYEIIDEGPAPGRRSLHARLSDLKNWDNYGPVAIERPFPEGHSLTVLSAKGGPETRGLAVEWQEKDGSRWIATVPLDTDWRQYVLAPEDFKFWQSVPERAKGRFRPQNAARMCIGMAFTHTGTTPGPQEWWVGAFGTAQATPELEDLVARPAIPRMDTLAPGYKFFESRGVAKLGTRQDQVVVASATFDVPEALRSPQPRPGGGGFGKGRTWRWIPLIEAGSPAGVWRGAPATLMAHSDGPFKGGQWAAFGVADSDWYTSPAAKEAIRQVARKMLSGVYIMDAGTNFYTYFADQKIELGVRAANLAGEARNGIVAKVSLTDADTDIEVLTKEWTMDLEPGAEVVVSDNWAPERWPEGGFIVTAQLLQDGAVIDQVSHEAHVWKPKEKKCFVTVKDGDFILDGKRWRAHGVNYMPSSGIGTEDGDYFEQWIGARAYDPEIIQRDLEHCKDLGLNSLSIFIYHQSMAAQNLLDLLRRLDALGLNANLSLRPGTPIDFEWDKMREMIEHYRLWDNDTVYAYDLAWEPLWWGHDKRKRWDKDWDAWIVERYGSIENAEKDWGFLAPRDEAGAVTNPSAQQLETDGEWRVMVCAYRRFLDTLLYKYYSEARTLVRSVDPNHLVSFRMTETGDPTMSWHGVLAYDFPYLAAAVDILEPEGYGRIGDWERVKPGWFEYEYARWTAPHLPVLWAEAGVHAWDMAAGISPPGRLEFQGEYYGHFYRMLINSGADGIYWWWYPGGFRYGENSDYGIINADGTDRPNSEAIREHAEAFTDGPDAKIIDHWIEIDRDARADGVVGIYKTVGDEFWKAIEDGHAPGLRTAGTGTNSGNCPLLAVGNTPCNGTNPPKYLDAFFDLFEVRDAQGDWVEVEKAAAVDVAADKPVVARATLTNLGEAGWLHEGDGAVFITVTAKDTTKTPLPERVAHFGTVSVEEIVLAPAGLKEPTEVTVSLIAEGRTPFGEKYNTRLVP